MEAYRSEFPCLDRMLFLNHASESPICKRVRRRLDEYLDAAMGDPDGAPIHVGRYKQLLAQLIHADPEEIAVMPNTATGTATIANGLQWRAGDNLLVPEQEYPANTRPWLALEERGVQVRRVPVGKDLRIQPEDFAARIDGRTRLVAVSHVEFLSGFRNDLRAIGALAHGAGALFVVDAIQSVGAVPVDVEADGQIDALCAGGYKWALGPVGTGFLYLRRSRWEQVRPSIVGSRSSVAGVADIDGNAPLLPHAGRYETGCMAWSLFHGWSAGLEMLLEIGPETIEAHLADLTGYLADGLTTLDYSVVTPMGRPAERAGIVSFAVGSPEATAATELRLRDQGIVIAHRGPYLRVSPHFYNSRADIDRLLAGLGRNGR